MCIFIQKKKNEKSLGQGQSRLHKTLSQKAFNWLIKTKLQFPCGLFPEILICSQGVCIKSSQMMLTSGNSCVPSVGTSRESPVLVSRNKELDTQIAASPERNFIKKGKRKLVLDPHGGGIQIIVSLFSLERERQRQRLLKETD